MTKLSDAVLRSEVHEEGNFQTADDFQRFFEAVDRNLDIFTEFFEHCNLKVDDTFDELVPIENDLTLFTYKKCDVQQYKPNAIGECVVTTIGNCTEGQCYINDLRA